MLAIGITAIRLLMRFPLLLILSTSSTLVIAREADKCNFAGKCLSALSVDVDGDGQSDRVELVYDPNYSLFHVIVATKAGRFYRPFSGHFDPAKGERLSLDVRNGSGDLRCQAWVEGSYCGHAIPFHDVSSPVLFLSHSTKGNFVLYMTFPEPARLRESDQSMRQDGFFVVMPALDGAASRIEPELRRRPQR